MSSYTSLAECYDEFTHDVEYSRWANYLIGLFDKYSDESGIHDVLDLACGTGSLSVILAERGFDVIGTDASEDMLAEAQAKAWNVSGTRPMFLHQSMESLDLYGTVDAAVSCLDSINYLTSKESLNIAFSRLRFFIRPGGLFIFDLNTHAKFEALDGSAFLRESDGYFCTWSAEYERSARLCTFYYDIFKSCGELWSREQEEHTERAHSHEEIKDALESADFSLVATFGELSPNPPKDNEQRIFYVARRN